MGLPKRSVVIACAPGDALVGARLQKAVAESGRDAALHQRAPSLKTDKAAFDAAETLILVWSRHTAVEPGLVREATAAGPRLVLVRLDAVRPPPALRGARSVALSLARPQRGAAALLDALAAKAGPNRKTPTPKGKARMNASPVADTGGRDERSTWRGTLLLTVLLTGIAWSAWFVVTGKPPVDLLALIAGLRA